MQAIETPLARLEPQVAAHAAEMFEVLCDPAIYTHENEPPVSSDWLRGRFARLESRRSADGREQWLNWVIRPHGEGLAGYVQATVHADRHASIAYVLASRYWGRGLAGDAVQAMMAWLAGQHGVCEFAAVLKRSNARSRRLLDRLGFAMAAPHLHRQRGAEPDEWLMCRTMAWPPTGK